MVDKLIEDLMLLFFNAHVHSFKTRLGLRSRFQVLTGSPCRPCQFFFFFKSKRRRFSKKTKVNGFATGS
jgi:hypothetical protein